MTALDDLRTWSIERFGPVGGHDPGPGTWVCRGCRVPVLHVGGRVSCPRCHREGNAPTPTRDVPPIWEMPEKEEK